MIIHYLISLSYMETYKLANEWILFRLPTILILINIQVIIDRLHKLSSRLWMINDEWWFSVSICTLNGYPVLVSTTNFKQNLLVSMVNSSSSQGQFYENVSILEEEEE